MRLLQRQSDGLLSLTEDHVDKIPPYAILSHTWGADKQEVTFQDIQNHTGQQKEGYEKLAFCGKQAAADSLHYFWVDTCCIDKSSSAELTEAINSMFRWYQNATKCYVYLPDVSLLESDGEEMPRSTWKSDFLKSRWFTRGWTLQELIAPKSVTFFSKEGRRLGDKVSLETVLHEITGIPVTALRGKPLPVFSVEERLSWRGKRSTKRAEDRVYSLLGIFDIYLPLIYGEGESNAFIRLREEIDKRSQGTYRTSNGKAAIADCSSLLMFIQLGKDMVSETGERCTANLRVTDPRHSKTRIHFLVPFGQNENFVGQDAVLHQLLERVPPAAHPDTCQRTIIEGLGGIGKTQVALEVAHRLCKAEPDCSVFWVPAVDKTSFENAYRDIGRALGLEGLDDKNADVTKLVKEALNQDDTGSWLLIIDNADHTHLLLPAEGTDSTRLKFDTTKLASYLPSSRKGSILFTTRNHQAAVRFDARQVPMKIDTLDYCNSIRLLHQGLQTSQIGNPHSTKQLLDCLTHLPLAIRQAAAYMASNSNVTIKSYLGYCRSSDETMIEILSEDFEDQDRYEAVQNAIAKTWLISFQQISQNDPLAAEYLQFSCYLAEKDIPISLLPLKGSEIKRDRAVGTLTAYAFITQRSTSGTTSDRFDIHRLVRLVMRNWLREHCKESEQVTSTVCELALKLQWPTHETWQTWAGYLPHTQALLVFGGGCADKKGLWKILSYTCDGNNMLGRYNDAAPFGRKAVKVARKALGEDHPDTLGSMNNLAEVLSSQGKYEEAEKMQWWTLQRMEKALGEDHPFTFTSMNNLASVLSSQGKYEEAESMHRQTLKRTEKALGKNHPDTLGSMNNLAEVLGHQGKYNKAERMHWQTLQRINKALGEDHPNTLSSINNLALVLSSQGKYEDAEKMHRQTLQRREKAFGEDHPSTLASMNNLAEVLSMQGKYDEAERIQRQTLQRAEKALGEDHPDTLISMNNLASVLSSQKKYKEAERMHWKELSLCRKALGEDHPDILTSMNNLALALSSQGEYEDAERIDRQTLHGRQKALGVGHPDTLTSMNNLAFVLSSQGKYGEAERIHGKTLQQREKALGRNHPDTLSSMNNLAGVLSMQGKYEEAERIQRQTLQWTERALGSAHPDTLISMNNLAFVLSSRGKYKEAERMHWKELSLCRKALGEGHPDTLTSMNDLAFVLSRRGKYEKADAIRRYIHLLDERTAEP